MSSPRYKRVVDTNVPRIANGKDEQDQSPDMDHCVRACIIAIEEIMTAGCLVVDDAGEIFGEYLRNLSLSGQPGAGDAFIAWVHNRYYLPELVEQVVITRNNEHSYDEFPDHDGLTKFDLSDRKFVAVANAHPDRPPILQARDSKWWGWKGALAEAGITVHFVCPELIEASFHKKMGKSQSS